MHILNFLSETFIAYVALIQDFFLIRLFCGQLLVYPFWALLMTYSFACCFGLLNIPLSILAFGSPAAAQGQLESAQGQKCSPALNSVEEVGLELWTDTGTF